MDTVSTKGNVTDFWNFQNSIDCIADRNPAKIIFTPQELKLKLLLRKFQEKLNLIIIWFTLHFKKILIEKNIRKRNLYFTKFKNILTEYFE